MAPVHWVRRRTPAPGRSRSGSPYRSSQISTRFLGGVGWALTTRARLSDADIVDSHPRWRARQRWWRRNRTPGAGIPPGPYSEEIVAWWIDGTAKDIEDRDGVRRPTRRAGRPPVVRVP